MSISKEFRERIFRELGVKEDSEVKSFEPVFGENMSSQDVHAFLRAAAEGNGKSVFAITVDEDAAQRVRELTNDSSEE